MSLFTDEELDKEPILEFFAFEHLPPHLKEISSRFAGLAASLLHELPKNAERTTAFRKLIEAKDCAVRARIATRPMKGVLS